MQQVVVVSLELHHYWSEPIDNIGICERKVVKMYRTCVCNLAVLSNQGMKL